MTNTSKAAAVLASCLVPAGLLVAATPAQAINRGVNLCIKNGTETKMIVDWRGVTSNTGTKLPPGVKVCAEGRSSGIDVNALLTLKHRPGDTLLWQASNPLIGRPYVNSNVNRHPGCETPELLRRVGIGCWSVSFSQNTHRCVTDPRTGLEYRVSRETNDSRVQMRIVVSRDCR